MSTTLDDLLDLYERLKEIGLPSEVALQDTLAKAPEALRERLAEAVHSLQAVQEWLKSQPVPTVSGGPTTPASTPAPPVNVPGFEVLRELGRGGMGVVYEAQQVALKRIVALKMVLAGAHAGPQELARFKAEAEAVARLHHRHIVQIHDVGEHAGQPYLVLEFLAGGSLAQKLHQQPQEPRAAAALVADLAEAVQAVHEQGIVHRDLKPGNVLFDSDGTAKITDFGLVKWLSGDGGVTDPTGAVLGTPSYMAPEQAAGRIKEIGPATDVYALGAILYECLTARPPFRAATLLDTLDLVKHADPVPPVQLQPKVPRDLNTICLKCLQKEPCKRYDSAAELAEDLRRFLNGQPIHARRTPWWEKVGKWARRRPAVAALGSALGVVMMVSLIVLGALWQRAEQARNQLSESDAAAQSVLNEFLVDELAPGPADEPKTVLKQLDALTTRARRRFAGQQGLLATALNFLANRYARLADDVGDHVKTARLKAAQLYREAYQIRFHAFGPDHPATFQSRNNCLCFKDEEPAVAVGKFYQAWQSARRALGDDHSMTLTLRHNWVWALYKQDHPDAKQECLALLKEREHVQGLDYPQTYTTRRLLADCLNKERRYREEIPIRDAVWKYYRDRFGSDHRTTIEAAVDLAEALLENGAPADAKNPAQAAVSAIKNVPRMPDVLRGRALVLLGWALLDSKQPDKAKPVLEQCLEVRRTLYPDEADWRLANTKVLLGATLAELKKFDAAKPLLLEGRQNLINHNADKNRIDDAKRRFGRFKKLWDQVAADKK